MKILTSLIAVLGLVIALIIPARAQVNWSLVIRDHAFGTPINQVNGVEGRTALLYATVINFTGTIASDDGNGNPVSATTLDFAGFGWILQPGQSDLESRFTPAADIPGEPQVFGSADGTTPGMSGLVILGIFDLTGLAPGVYEEDFVASAFADDFTSPVFFGDITGTLRLNVSTANAPEPATVVLILPLLYALVYVRKPKCQASQ